MPKINVKEFMTDPKNAEQKESFKELLSAVADEMRTERDAKNPNPKKKKNDDEDVNFFDSFFGGA